MCSAALRNPERCITIYINVNSNLGKKQKQTPLNSMPIVEKFDLLFNCLIFSLLIRFLFRKRIALYLVGLVNVLLTWVRQIFVIRV